MRYISFLALLLSVGFCSCQKVINVNLNNANPKYVITGNVTDQPGPYTVKISSSINFDQDNNFPGVSNALVYITDVSANITDTLTEVSAGQYQTHSLSGVPGHIYRLSVNIAGQMFTSTEAMPKVVTIDSIYTQTAMFDGKKTDVVTLFKDPLDSGNYYHLLLTVNDSLSQQVFLYNDDNNNGREISRVLRNDIKMNHGDSVKVELQCIDYGVFRYYQTLQQTMAQNSAAPANPQTNIDGGALGYFSAHTVRRRGVVAP